MPYSEHDLNEIGRDPIRLRAFYWHMEQHWKRLAREYRAQSHAQARKVVGETYEMGAKLLDWAGTLERCADMLEKHGNVDLFVRSTLDPAHCTCPPSTPAQREP